LQKGAIVGLDPFNPLASVIVFQYNPWRLTRSLQPRTTDDVDKGEALRLMGPPEETFEIEADLDAADQLEAGQASAGLHPALAALEMLLYPKSGLVLANEALSRLGVIEVIAPEVPLALFVWGKKRVLPVRLTGLGVTELAYDPDLNPIRAEITLSLRVLSYHDLGLPSVGGAIFMAHQISKELQATLSSAGNVPPPALPDLPF
jgi:hypothetical protein